MRLPQGGVLGSSLFLLNSKDITRIVAGLFILGQQEMNAQLTTREYLLYVNIFSMFPLEFVSIQVRRGELLQVTKLVMFVI